MFTCVLFAVYLLALTWLVLFKLQFSIPVVEEGRVVNLIPFMGTARANGVIAFGEIRNNIVVFVPLGIYLCLLKADWRFVKKLLAIFALTVGFETAQYVFVIGRADITDVLSNTFGGIIGIVVYALLAKLLKDKTNKIIIAIAAVVTISAILLIGYLMINNRWIRIR